MWNNPMKDDDEMASVGDSLPTVSEAKPTSTNIGRGKPPVPLADVFGNLPADMSKKIRRSMQWESCNRSCCTLLQETAQMHGTWAQEEGYARAIAEECKLLRSENTTSWIAEEEVGSRPGFPGGEICKDYAAVEKHTSPPRKIIHDNEGKPPVEPRSGWRPLPEPGVAPPPTSFEDDFPPLSATASPSRKK